MQLKAFWCGSKEGTIATTGIDYAVSGAHAGKTKHAPGYKLGGEKLADHGLCVQKQVQRASRKCMRVWNRATESNLGGVGDQRPSLAAPDGPCVGGGLG